MNLDKEVKKVSGARNHSTKVGPANDLLVTFHRSRHFFNLFIIIFHLGFFNSHPTVSIIHVAGLQIPAFYRVRAIADSVSLRRLRNFFFCFPSVAFYGIPEHSGAFYH